MKLFIFGCIILSGIACVRKASIPEQKQKELWHNTERSLRYHPEGEDFVITNGSRRFNRALYGTNTAFRIEAGDLPEFALYMPGMGGCLRFGLISDKSGKWLIDVEKITARYRPGSMLYEIQDAMLGKGKLNLSVIAMDDGEGMILRAEFIDAPENLCLFWAFGGATGKRFHRDGDIGADPESVFYLRPEYCTDNFYKIRGNTFTLYYGSGKRLSETDLQEIDHFPEITDRSGRSAIRVRQLVGITPPISEMRLVDAANQQSPQVLLASGKSGTPVIAGVFTVRSGKEYFFVIQNPETRPVVDYSDIPELFIRAEDTRRKLAGRVRVNTPDPYINTLGGSLGIAADAIWEEPSYLHGAVAWRTRLNGWRGAYAGDPLGWHDRTRMHVSSYALSQMTSPSTGPVMPDTALHLARQKEIPGTALFSSGYISRYPNGNIRCHHYDMNLVFIDNLLRHFEWTGDIPFIREMWPVLTRHLAWEKRCFDADDDGLYDAYCCIWASDALQYSSGGVAHSSAYNYRSNKMAADLAERIGKNAHPYRMEAEKIHRAMNTELWIPSKGWYAEYNDFSGLQQLHPAAALWTVYHAIDSDVPDIFQAYQALRYIDTEIPHIPVRASGLTDKNLYLLSTTNWMPYTWSLNNVALAEILHTALAYWQTGRVEEAFLLWKSALIESMYLGSSPGNFQQLAFYDAMRGELYRDFADPIGMAARTLIEGLFGIIPDALEGNLLIRPGLPAAWDHASLNTPDISFHYAREKNTDHYTLIPSFEKPMKLTFHARAMGESVKELKVNGKTTNWVMVDQAIGEPLIEFRCDTAQKCSIKIVWEGKEPEKVKILHPVSRNDQFAIRLRKAEIIKVFDPQKVFADIEIHKDELQARIVSETGNRTAFLKIQQGQFSWWEPLCLDIKEPVEIISSGNQEEDDLKFRLYNHTASAVSGTVTVNPGTSSRTFKLKIAAHAISEEIVVPSVYSVTGSNRVLFEWEKGKRIEEDLTNWHISNTGGTTFETIDLSNFFNDKVTNIFKNEYRSPRSPYPTLQIPLQGIGNWCYPLVEIDIDDSGLRTLAGDSGKIILPQGIPFKTTGINNERNIIFTSKWNNYPDEVSLPLSGTANHAYFLLAGSTNPMQSRFDNGKIVIEYEDGTEEWLTLRNPETWWPIEQDYYEDGFAFCLNAEKPVRVYLKTGIMTTEFNNYITISGFTDRAIEGGAATVLDLPLDLSKNLKQLKLITTANEVVIGLMSITLVRD